MPMVYGAGGAPPAHLLWSLDMWKATSILMTQRLLRFVFVSGFVLIVAACAPANPEPLPTKMALLSVTATLTSTPQPSAVVVGTSVPIESTASNAVDEPTSTATAQRSGSGGQAGRGPRFGRGSHPRGRQCCA